MTTHDNTFDEVSAFFNKAADRLGLDDGVRVAKLRGFL